MTEAGPSVSAGLRRTASSASSGAGNSASSGTGNVIGVHAPRPDALAVPPPSGAPSGGPASAADLPSAPPRQAGPNRLAGLPSSALRRHIGGLPDAAAGGLDAAARKDLTAALNYRGLVEADQDQVAGLVRLVEAGTASVAEKTALGALLQRHADALGLLTVRLNALLGATHASGTAASQDWAETITAVGAGLVSDHQGLADLATELSDDLVPVPSGAAADAVWERVTTLSAAQMGLGRFYPEVATGMVFGSDGTPPSAAQAAHVAALQRLGADLSAETEALKAEAEAREGQVKPGDYALLLSAPGAAADDGTRATQRLRAILTAPAVAWAGDVDADVAATLSQSRSIAIGRQEWPNITGQIIIPLGPESRPQIFNSQMIPGGGQSIRLRVPQPYEILARPVTALRAPDIHQHLHVPGLALSTLTPEPGPDGRQRVPAYVSLRHGVLDAPGLSEQALGAMAPGEQELVEEDLGPFLPPGRTLRADMPLAERSALLREAAAFRMAQELTAAQLALDDQTLLQALGGETVPVALHMLALPPPNDGGAQAADAQTSWQRQQRAIQRLENGGQPLQIQIRNTAGAQRSVSVRVRAQQWRFEGSHGLSAGRAAAQRQNAAALQELLGPKSTARVGGEAGTALRRLDAQIAQVGGQLDADVAAARARASWLNRRNEPGAPRLADIPQALSPPRKAELHAQLRELRQERFLIPQLAQDLKQVWRTGATSPQAEELPARAALLLFLMGALPIVSSADGQGRAAQLDAAAKHLAARTEASPTLLTATELPNGPWLQERADAYHATGQQTLERLNRGLPIRSA